MTKNTKKLLTIFGSILGVGVITTSITLPLVLRGKTFSLKENETIYENKTIKDLVKEYEERFGKENVQLTKFDQFLAFFLYEIEQKESIKLQKMWFKWEIFSLKKDIEIIKNDTKLKEKERQEKIDEVNKKIEKVQERLNIIKDNNVEYKDSFKNDYPKILETLDRIRDKQKAVYEDSKENFITSQKFKNRIDGIKAWEEERKKQYNNAEKDEEAIEYLTYKQIVDKALSQFKFKIISEYTLEQKLAKDDEGNAIFPFLKDAVQSHKEINDLDKIGKNRQNKKVYFLGSGSNDPNKIAINLDNSSDVSDKILEKIANQNLIKVAHALIVARQNKNDGSLAWEFDKNDSKEKEALKNLLQHFTNKDKNRQSIIDTLQKIFKNEDDTKTFIDFFGGDPSGKEKNGSLGIMSLVDYIEKMNGGFGFGILAILAGKKDDQSKSETKIKDYIEELSKELKKVYKEIFGEREVNDNEIKNLDQDKIKKFGDVFRKVFGDKLNLSYPAGKDKDGNEINIVISEEGVHIVKITKFDNKEKLIEEIKKDLQKLANGEKEETNWGELFGNHFKDNFQRKFIIDNYIKDEKLQKFIDEKNQGLEKDKQVNLKDIKEIIKLKEELEKEKKVDKAIGKKVQDFYIEEIDKNLREIDKTLTPKDVYNTLLDKILQGGK